MKKRASEEFSPNHCPDWRRGCHQCRELAVLCSQSLKGAVLTRSQASDGTLGILTDPLAARGPWEGVQQRRGLIPPPFYFTLLKSAVVHGGGPCLRPCPSWDGPGRPNSSGLMLMSVFPRHLSERGRVPVRAGRGTGHLPSCHHTRLSP